MIRSLSRAVMIAVSSALSLGMISGVANADGKVTWQNNATGHYLEVYHSSTAEGAGVDTWTWNGSDTQYWYDTKLSNGYWLEENWNSGLLMTAYNTCSQGITQWGLGTLPDGWTTQQWKEFHHGTGVWELINHAGCDGNPYQDTLAEAQGNSVYIYTEGDASAPATCYTYSDTPIVPCTWN